MFKNKFRNDSKRSILTSLLILSVYLLEIFAIITILVVFVPLNPGMPHSGLDPSWAFSMNEAVAQHLRFGEEVIFTLGPYASIYTQSYHPATDHLMVFGGLFLGLCYAASLLYLAKDKEPYFLIALLVFLTGYSYSRDALFLSYPLILCACVFKFISGDVQHEKANLHPWQILTIAFVFAPFGLLPLIKGSLLLICGTTAVVLATYCLDQRYRKLAAIILLSPLVATAIFWLTSGQSILSLSGYFINMLQITSGYTEAMAVRGNDKEILVYLIAAVAIIWALLKSDKKTVSGKVILGGCFALFLFIAFKGGFVRHDGHAIVAGTSIVISVLIMGLIVTDKRLVIALLLSITVWAYIDKGYVNISGRQFFQNISNTYAGAWYGLRSRLTESNNLQNKFEHSVDDIKRVSALPSLQGTSDIFSYDQATLFASNNKWNPRPIIQSYAAYTPKFAQLNEQHFRRHSAPDNVLFRIQPIDGHLPSLEDGFSWPALFDNFTVTKLDDDLAYLRKKQVIKSSSTFDVLYERMLKTGEDVVLPTTSDPIYARIDLKPTLLGKLLGTIFKHPQLKITLKLKDGVSKDYRVLSNMMNSGFFISPLIENTKDFVFLATGNQRYLEHNTVQSFMITPSFGDSILWNSTYTLELKTYHGEVEAALPENFFDGMSDFIPVGYVKAQPIQCDGSIDAVNGVSVPQLRTNISNQLSVEGWLAVSAVDGIVPDDIFITLKNPNESTRYIKTRRTVRNDVKAHFKQPTMPDVGYAVTVDAARFNDKYALGLARGYKGKLEQCVQFNIPVKFDAEK